MSGWTAVDDTGNDVEGEKVEGPIDDVANDEDVSMEIEESDEAYQSRLSMNYRAALTDQSKVSLGLMFGKTQKNFTSKYLRTPTHPWTLEPSDWRLQRRFRHRMA